MATTTPAKLTAMFTLCLRYRIINTKNDAKAMRNEFHLAVVSFVSHTKSNTKTYVNHDQHTHTESVFWLGLQ